MSIINLISECSLKEKLILELVYRYKAISRTQLLEHTGLKIATLYRTIELLIKKKLLITEQDNTQSLGNLGRPSEMICINGSLGYSVCIILFRSYCCVGIMDLSGQLINNSKFGINEFNNLGELLEAIKTSTLKLLQLHSIDIKNTFGIFISSVGQIDEKRETILNVINPPVCLKENFDIKNKLYKIFKKPIIVNNIVSCAALGKHINLKKEENLIYIIVNEGISSNVVLGNYQPSSCISGLGHMVVDISGKKCGCGSYGCLETFCSTIAIKNEIIKNLKIGIESCLSSKVDSLRLSDIYDAVKSNDQLAVEVVKKSAAVFCIGLKNYLNITPVNILYLGGELITDCPLFFEAIKHTIENQYQEKLLYSDLEIEKTIFSGANAELLLSMLKK